MSGKCPQTRCKLGEYCDRGRGICKCKYKYTHVISYTGYLIIYWHKSKRVSVAQRQISNNSAKSRREQVAFSEMILMFTL